MEAPAWKAFIFPTAPTAERLKFFLDRERESESDSRRDFLIRRSLDWTRRPRWERQTYPHCRRNAACLEVK
jgi:hypothetical protein